MLKTKKSCPRCGCDELYRSRRRSFEKGFLLLFDWVPFRCEACNHRFYSKNPRRADAVPARQPAPGISHS